MQGKFPSERLGLKERLRKRGKMGFYEELTKLADEYLEEWDEDGPLARFASTQEAYVKGVYDFSDWLKQKMRCPKCKTERVPEEGADRCKYCDWREANHA